MPQCVHRLEPIINHPPGNNSMRLYTKNFLNFQGVVPEFSPPNFGPPTKKAPQTILPVVYEQAPSSIPSPQGVKTFLQ